MGTQAEQLRDTLVGQLLEAGAVRSPRVEAAMRAVPRHAFLPGVPLRQCYANDVVQTKRDSDGVPISAASQPSIVAIMLEQLAVEPGTRILEIGAGTGYNAALLGYLAGPDGQVVAVDVDDDIVARARMALAGTGTANVTVVAGDGALGAPGFAPFDRIIASVGIWDLPLAWQEQLAPGGRIVAPLRLRGSVTRSVAFERPAGAPGGWPTALRSRSSVMCGFMPLRASIASDPRRTIALTPSGDVTLEVQQEQEADPDLLAGVLDTKRVTVRTGVGFTDVGSAEWMYLWLTCTLPGGLFGLSVRQPAAERGIVTPMFRWGAMAAVDGDSMAYLTFGPANDLDTPGDDDGDGGSGEPREIGVIGHGTRGPELAATVAEQIRVWDRNYRSRTAEFTIRPLTAPGPGEPEPADGTDAGISLNDPAAISIRTPHNLITVSWRDGSTRSAPA